MYQILPKERTRLAPFFAGRQDTLILSCLQGHLGTGWLDDPGTPACAARLILECLHRGLYPSWGAATPHSLVLAERLGYHFSHSYPTYIIARPGAAIHPLQSGG